MDLIRIAIDRPIAVIAAVLMIVMFGFVALTAIPIQLAPDVNKPIITVETNWLGAAPAEVEREIINRQEDKLRGLEGLSSMESRSRDGRGEITLEFNIGQDMDRALLLVANRLDRVESYPEEADEPILGTSSNEDTPIVRYMVVAAEGNERNVETYGDWIEDNIVERMTRVDGIADVLVYGGREREMLVEVQPSRLARYRLTADDVLAALREANISTSAGDVDEGKRRYIVRTEGDLSRLDQVKEIVLRSDADAASGRISRVTVGDIADVRFDYKEKSSQLRYLGRTAVSVWVQRETGANVMRVVDALDALLPELQAQAAANGLEFFKVYDDTVYIDQAIELVTQNLWAGGVLAAIVLFAFLRSGRATAIIAIAMPISVIGAFVAMAVLGRSLNVISMAGMAFAIGMVVDAAIVVLENIFRLRQAGMPAAQAAYRGAKQVWGAILVSALTTVMVFIPILVMDLEVGQLFRDIAVAISVSVLLSLVVATTVIPALSSRLFASGRSATENRRIAGIDALATGFSRLILRQTDRVLRNRQLAGTVVIGITAVAGLLTWALLPKLEYLPEGNRNWLGGFIQPPPGYNLDTVQEIVGQVEADTKPLWASETGMQDGPQGLPKIADFFSVARENGSYIGLDTHDPTRLRELKPFMNRTVFQEPGTFGFFSQSSLFGRGVGGSRAIDLDISGPDLEQLFALGAQAAGRVAMALPFDQGTQMRPLPGLELGAPEVRVIPRRTRLADAGLSARDLAVSVDTFNDGIRIAEITVGGDRMDLTLSGQSEPVSSTQGVGSLPVVTPDGDILPVASLAEVMVTAGPTEILRKERQRTLTLSIRPAQNIALEEAMERLETQVIAPMTAEGLPPGMTMRLSGTADQLTKTWNAMLFDLLMALVIVYLVMAVLLENFWYPALIIFSVPLATAGGVLGLGVLNWFTYQPLDMLTMLGFVILIGIVVNNAILLVHQALQLHREEGAGVDEAIREATGNRIRPIFMSTLTSVFGMLPLVLFPGAGSELYRGLGSVVVGGLSLSALLTLLIIPALLTLTMRLIESGRPESIRVPKTAGATPQAAE